MPINSSLKFFVCITLLAVGVQDTQAADSDSSKQGPHTGYLASYWYNAVGLVASPLHWRGDDWAKFGGTVAISSVIISMDEPLSQPFFDWQTTTGKNIGNAGQFLGNGATQFSISGLAIGAGLIAHNKPLQHFGLDNLQAQLYTAGLTVFIKELMHRERPSEGNGSFEWHGPFKGAGNESFFSGHTSMSFCTATMIFLHSHKKWWVGVLSYGLASGVAVSRMQKQAHWASDVAVGAVVGSAVANFVYKQQEKRRLAIKKMLVIP